jgi:hypothetical protein
VVVLTNFWFEHLRFDKFGRLHRTPLAAAKDRGDAERKCARRTYPSPREGRSPSVFQIRKLARDGAPHLTRAMDRLRMAETRKRLEEPSLLLSLSDGE